MSQTLELPDDLYDRLERAARDRGLPIEQLLGGLIDAAEADAQPPTDAEDVETLAADTRALLTGAEPQIVADWPQIAEVLRTSEPEHATVEDAMSALRSRPWTMDA